MKKFLSVILTIAMLFSVLSVGISAKSTRTSRLQFNDNGKFKVLLMTDFQDDMILDSVTKDFIKVTIEQEQPDLIVLDGDNISGNKFSTGIKALDTAMVKEGIDQFMSIFEKYGIPVTATFGNHDDDETLVSKEEQFEMYCQYDCFIGYDDYPELYGCGNHNLPVYSSKNEYKPAYNFYIIDSGAYHPEGGYDHIRDDQVEWYLNTSNSLKEANGGELVPSMVFQHIVVRDILAIMEECPEGTPNSIREGSYADGSPRYIKFKDENYICGNVKEGPSPGNRDSKEFSAMVEQGDVVAMFFGHDHNDSYEVNLDGIDLVLTPGFSFQSYGNEDRGFRVINLDENDTSTYESHLIKWQDIYGSSKMAMNHYTMYCKECGTWERILAAIKYLPFVLVKLVAGYVF